MRIAICTVGELFGGVERHVLWMLSALQAQGIDAVPILFHNGELAVRARELGVEPLILSARNVSLIATCRRLAGFLRRRDIAILHAHGYKATVFCAIARAWYRFALIKTEHGLPEPMAAGRASALRNRFYYFLDATATRMARATVCYVAEDIRKHYARAHAGLPMFVIPNGVPCMDRRRHPRPPDLAKGYFNLLMVGRLDEVKGHDVAIKALATGAIAPDIHLNIVGTGPRHAELLRLAQVLGIADRVHLLGFRRNAYDYMAHCDALLMPSLHEGLPYALLEAMALGVPIIASAVGGLAEVIENGVTGLLVAPRSGLELAPAIQRLHADDGLRTRLAAGAQAAQRSRYSLDTMTSRYLRVYGCSVA
jgi:glycosyltransferase involved in cell wall biosynthesis